MTRETSSSAAVGYADVAATLRRRVLDGDYPAGARLPSEEALALELGVTRAVVRRALAQLARQSLVASRPHDGWVVEVPHRTQGLDRMQTFSQWAQSGGREPGGRIVTRERRPADAREAQQLGIRLDEPLLSFTRVRTLDGAEVMIERSTWAPWVAETVDGMPDDVVSTTAALADEGIRVTAGLHRIEAVAASTQDAGLLGVRRASPLLQVSRVTTTREGRIVELGTDRYRADSIAFEVTAGEGIRVA